MVGVQAPLGEQLLDLAIGERKAQVPADREQELLKHPLINAGVLPKSVSSGADEDLMGQGKLAMMISRPWAWSSRVRLRRPALLRRL